MLMHIKTFVEDAEYATYKELSTPIQNDLIIFSD